MAKKVIILLLVIYASSLAALTILQKDFIFPAPKYIETPQAAGIGDFSEIELISPQSTKIYGWFYGKKSNKKTIVYFPGNAESLAQSGTANFLKSLAEQNFNVFAVQYSGYGKSSGTASEQSFYESGRTVIDFLKSKMAEKSIVVLGRSIGSGVATQMGTEYHNLGAVILWSPFNSIEQTATDAYPYYPIKTLDLVSDKFDSLSKIKNVTSPLLVIYGEKDNLVLPTHSQELFNAANEPKKIIPYPDADHFNFDNDAVIQEIKSFLGTKNARTAGIYNS